MDLDDEKKNGFCSVDDCIGLNCKRLVLVVGKPG